jgi:hypothetical protein
MMCQKSVSEEFVRIISIICFVFAAALGLGALIHVQKPSYSPLLTVFGAFVLPLLLAWWGVLLWHRGALKAQVKMNKLPDPMADERRASALRRNVTLAFLALTLLGSAAVMWRSADERSRLILGNTRAQYPTAVFVTEPIKVSATCPENVRLLSFQRLRIRNPQYAEYSDAELSLALVQLCYPSEQPDRLAQRLSSIEMEAR